MTKEQAEQILIEVIGQLKLTKKEYETLFSAIKTLASNVDELSKPEKKTAAVKSA